jgi:hypothetical protein
VERKALAKRYITTSVILLGVTPFLLYTYLVPPSSHFSLDLGCRYEQGANEATVASLLLFAILLAILFTILFVGLRRHGAGMNCMKWSSIDC